MKLVSKLSKGIFYVHSNFECYLLSLNISNWNVGSKMGISLWMKGRCHCNDISLDAELPLFLDTSDTQNTASPVPLRGPRES